MLEQESSTGGAEVLICSLFLQCFRDATRDPVSTMTPENSIVRYLGTGTILCGFDDIYIVRRL
jgi:hypothetical protein